MNIGTKVGRAKHTRVMPGGSLEQEPSSVFVGSKLEDHRGAFILDYPMSKGCVKDDQGWESMERIWEVCAPLLLLFVTFLYSPIILVNFVLLLD